MPIPQPAALRHVLPVVLIGLLVLAAGGGAYAQDTPPGDGGGLSVAALAGTGFTYAGELQSGGSPVNGACDFRVSLHEAASGGAQVGATETVSGVTVTNGRFTVLLNSTGLFGARAFDGSARWLNFAVRCPAGGGSFTVLAPRQPLTPAPLALALPGLRTEQNPSSPNVVGGYISNTVGVGVVGATIGGGGGPGVNQVGGHHGTVGGGTGNAANGQNATVSGGAGNFASALHATVGGGTFNVANGLAAVVAGGQLNAANDEYATVGGGLSNAATEIYAAVGGGTGNTASGVYAAVGGGFDNTAAVTGTTVSGGSGNTASGLHATVSGGQLNLASALAAVAAGGQINLASGEYATVSGGQLNNASQDWATVGGGRGNTASGLYATVGGGHANTASGQNATVSGGYSNTVSSLGATVGGGVTNTATIAGATVGGGEGNTASGEWATVGGGERNTASGNRAVVGGGWVNIASGGRATVGGGVNNEASGDGATVGGGAGNAALGQGATIPGGAGNLASALYSFAAGRHAHAVHAGTFVWSSYEPVTPIESTAANQFLVRATGGVSLTTNVGGTTGCNLSAGGGTWNCTSDRNLKENFAPVDGVAILHILAGIPIETWNFNTQDAAVRHLGPMAQDWYAAFGLGEGDTTISAVDADGVALAAIQGLYTVVQEKESLLEEQQAEFAALNERVAALETTVETSARRDWAGRDVFTGAETSHRDVSTGGHGQLLLGLALGAGIAGAGFALGRRGRSWTPSR